MNLSQKKISPQAILGLKEALSVIFWKKEELRDFIKLTLHNSAIVGTLNWEGTKRESVMELIERMINRQAIYKEDLMNLLLAVTDFTDFPHLEFWDEDGSKVKRAREAVENLRTHTKGYIQLTQEQEEAKKRRSETEKRIVKNKSLEDELNVLREKFNKLATKTDLQQRGFDLEKFLNELSLLYELNPKGSFKNYGEQIDGAFTYDGTDYLLEAKWKRQVDRGDLSRIGGGRYFRRYVKFCFGPGKYFHHRQCDCINAPVVCGNYERYTVGARRCIINICRILKYKIEDIADACGYNNISNFNRQFLLVTGRTPREYIIQIEKL